MLQLRFFASLREAVGVDAEHIELPAGVTTVADLTRWLQARDPAWQAALSNANIRTAVNHTVVAADTALADGDEVAWFPPVTGG